MKVIRKISMVLIIIGALNWGLIGFFNFNLVEFLFNGDLLWLARTVYAIVGLSAIMVILDTALSDRKL